MLHNLLHSQALWPWLTQGCFGASRDQTTNLLFSRRPALPPEPFPAAPKHFNRDAVCSCKAVVVAEKQTKQSRALSKITPRQQSRGLGLLPRVAFLQSVGLFSDGLGDGSFGKVDSVQEDVFVNLNCKHIYEQIINCIFM